ncbi:hypothetical protein GUJ93_ZPchr0012g19659 [Zizania palustris]|uniref:Uncharacterized protein n=1 Tax=Zizania palustris TaxID=103762 RepID=A0A8J6BR30_ZIZPA|nr:hypothetical protein GUJ93_ZPchr0012g19659 [Zizania palustris]
MVQQFVDMATEKLLAHLVEEVPGGYSDQTEWIQELSCYSILIRENKNKESNEKRHTPMPPLTGSILEFSIKIPITRFRTTPQRFFSFQAVPKSHSGPQALAPTSEDQTSSSCVKGQIQA